MAEAKARLRDLHAMEVSLVPKAANQRRFLLLKMDGGEEGEFEDDSTVTPRQSAEDGPRGPMKKEDGEEMSKQQFLPVRKEDGAWDFSGIPEEVRPTVEALWKQNEEAVRKAADLERILNEERDQRLTREYIAKAAEFTSLPVKAEEFGPVLKAVAEKAPEEYAKIESLLKAANEQLRQASLFAEVGKSGAGAGGSAWAKIEAAAASLVQKADGRMTREQAIAEVMQFQPELYNEYLRERGAV